MKKSFICSALIILIFLGCSENSSKSSQEEITLVASSGNMVTMTGVWASDCTPLGNGYINETFTFNEEDAEIDINFFDVPGCAGTPAGKENIRLAFTVGSTYDVTLNGVTVLANKIEGTSVSDSDNMVEQFKQAFYVDDSSNPYKLYHGVFADDGGQLTSDGYPLELHDAELIKQ